MEAALAIAAIIVAVAFAVLVGYIAQTLVAAKRTLNNVADTLEGLEKQVEGITTETTLLLAKTNDLAGDITNKSTKLDNIFFGVDELGGTFFKLTQSLNRLSSNITKTSTEDVEKASQAVKWGTAILNLVNKRK